MVKLQENEETLHVHLKECNIVMYKYKLYNCFTLAALPKNYTKV